MGRRRRRWCGYDGSGVGPLGGCVFFGHILSQLPVASYSVTERDSSALPLHKATRDTTASSPSLCPPVRSPGVLSWFTQRLQRWT